MTARSSMMRSFDISGFRCTCLKSKLTSFCSSSGGRYGMLTMIAKRSAAASDSGKRALAELDRVHRRDREAERRQLVGHLADGDRAILQPLEKRALRLERDAVDFVEQNDFGRGERPELGDELAGGRVDHLKADDLGGLQVGAPLEAGELRVADGGEDDAEERLADARHAAQQQIARH